MFEIFISFSSIVISLYLWGIIRTSIWLLPGLALPALFPVTGGSLLGFWLLLAWTAPFREGGYDLRSWERDKWAAVFLGSGILTGILFYPTPLTTFGLGALIPLLLIRIFRIFRHPLSPILYLPKKRLRWALLIVWVLSFTLKYVILETS